MRSIQTHYCRVQWNELMRIYVEEDVEDVEEKDKEKIHFELGYRLKGSEEPVFFKWKYNVEIAENKSDKSDKITLKCVDVIDKEKRIDKEEVKYNIWHTEKCNEMEKRFPKFAKDLIQNFPKEDWSQIIIELFPSISCYPQRHCMLDSSIVKDNEKEILMFENMLAKDWIQNKRRDNWDNWDNWDIIRK